MLRDLSTLSSDTLAGLGIRSALFFAPVAVLLALAVGSLYFAGELTDPVKVVQNQETTPALYYPIAHPRSVLPKYKLAGATIRQPDTLVLGSSRANSVRSEFVRDRFYNAAVWSAVTVGFVRPFLMRLPQSHLPRHLLLTIDPWWFYRAVPVQPESDFFRASTPFEIVDFSWRTGLSWLIRRQAYNSPNRIGIAAKELDGGIRPDGSFVPGSNFIATRPNIEKGQFEEFVEGTDPWFHTGSAAISGAAIDEMKRLLEYCSRFHISVIGYISPLHPALYQAVRKDQRLNINFQVAPILAQVFQQYKFPFIDLQNPAKSGCQTDEFVDLVHESEVCTVRNFLAMAQQDLRVTAVVDPDKLRMYLVNRRSEWQLGF